MGAAWGRIAGALLAAGAMLAATAPGARAFEALREAVARLPVEAAPATGFLFDFLSPRTVRGWKAEENPGIGELGLNAALAKPEPAQALTGIDFPNLTAIVTLGAPPDDVVYLAGPDLTEASIGKALLSRGFEKSSERGAAVFAKGEDDRMDLGARDPVDPFGKNLGMAERIAVGPRGVLAARAWTPLRRALTMIAGGEGENAGMGETLEAAVAIAADARGDDAEAFSASGFTLAAFAGMPPDVTSLDDAAPADPPVGEPTLPPFLFAFLIASTGGREEAVQIALAFPDRATAEIGVVAVTTRLRAYKGGARPTSARIEATVAEGRGPEAFAVVTVIFPDGRKHPAVKELAAWRRDIYRRGFSVLAIAP